MAQAPAFNATRPSGGEASGLTQPRKWLMERCGGFTQFGQFIDEKSPQLVEFGGEFHLLLRSYGPILLTMIKIVLIAGISFAALCQ